MAREFGWGSPLSHPSWPPPRLKWSQLFGHQWWWCWPLPGTIFYPLQYILKTKVNWVPEQKKGSQTKQQEKSQVSWWTCTYDWTGDECTFLWEVSFRGSIPRNLAILENIAAISVHEEQVQSRCTKVCCVNAAQQVKASSISLHYYGLLLDAFIAYRHMILDQR